MEFYGYKKCSTCREAHKFLQEQGLNLEFHDFVVNPPSTETVSKWVSQHGQGIQPFINRKGTVYRERNLKDVGWTEDEWIRELSEDGKLLKRPLLITDQEIVIGFDQTAYARIGATAHA